MHSVEQKLFNWHRLYKQLEEARQQLRAASSHSGIARAAIEAEVQRLQHDSDRALAEMQSLLAQRRPHQHPSGAPRS